MARSDKRARQKENTRAAREARESALRRQRRVRTAKRVSIVAVVAAAAIGLAAWLSSGDDADDVAVDATTTTLAAEDTTTTSPIPLPESCIDTEPEPVDERPTFDAPPEMEIDPGTAYVAKLETSCGYIAIELDAQNAPTGVNNFVFLARRGFYDGLTFHRVVGNFVIQGGDPLGDGTGDPGYKVVTELPADGYRPGTVAWAKGGAEEEGTAGSQFFIVTGDDDSRDVAFLSEQPQGKYQYGAFGRVVEGLEVARLIESLANEANAPAQPVYIYSVEIEER